MLFTAALLVSSVLTHYVRNKALKYGYTCTTIRRRDIHSSPIPRLGGVAICLTFLLVATGYVAFYRLRGISIGFGLYTTFAILAPATLMFILGLVDDARNIASQIKFGVQIIAALLLYYGGIRIYFLPAVAGYHQLNGLISLVLTVLWVLLISNAFNLIDGLDGLSAGSALFSTLVVFVVSLFSGNPFVAVMSVTLAGRDPRVLALQLQPSNHLSRRLRQSLPRLHAQRSISSPACRRAPRWSPSLSPSFPLDSPARHRFIRSSVAFLADSPFSAPIASTSTTNC